MNQGDFSLWKICIVSVVYLLQWLIDEPAMEAFLAEACPIELQQQQVAMRVTIIWIFAALVCAAIDVARISPSRGRDADPQEEAPLLNSSA
jgi:hypothetical protein